MLSDGPSPQDVYAQLYADHAGDVLQYLTNRLRDPDVAQDVAQDAWLKAHRGLPDVLNRGDTAGKSWLMRVATNAMVDHWRRVKARPQAQDIDDALASGGVAVLTDATTPEDALLATEADEGTRAALAETYLLLPWAERRLLWWFEMEGWSYGRIANALGTSVPAIKSRLYRVRERQRLLATPAPTPRPRRPLLERFWGSVEGGRGVTRRPCWRWLRRHDRHGVALFRVKNLEAGLDLATCARRLAYSLVRGPLAPWVVLHPSCEHAWCVNPFHMVPCGRRRAGGASRGTVVLPPSRPGFQLGDPAVVRARRVALGVTKRSLAATVGTSATTVSMLEHGRFVLPNTVAIVLAALDRLERERIASGRSVPSGPPPDGPTLRTRRRALGLTGRRVANEAGLTPDGLCRIELQRHGGAISTRRRIAEALDRLERERQEVTA